MTQQPLVSIGEASQILGVSEVTLRQWTDEGKIKAYITPGGHRRYSRAELERFMTSSRKMLDIKDLAAEIEETTQLHREIVREHLSATPWYNAMSQQAREQLALLGRQILALIIRYISRPDEQDDIILSARELGHSYGETLARLKLSLTDSVSAFTLHREPIMNAATRLIRKREAVSERVMDAVPLVARIMDEVLVSLVEAHQKYRDGFHNESKEGTA